MASVRLWDCTGAGGRGGGSLTALAAAGVSCQLAADIHAHVQLHARLLSCTVPVRMFMSIFCFYLWTLERILTHSHLLTFSRCVKTYCDTDEGTLLSRCGVCVGVHTVRVSGHPGDRFPQTITFQYHFVTTLHVKHRVCLGRFPPCMRINNPVYHVGLCLANRFPSCQARLTQMSLPEEIFQGQVCPGDT